MTTLQIFLAALVAGGTVFYALTVLAVVRLVRRAPPRRAPETHLTLLKPLSGMNTQLERLVESFFHMKPGPYELVLGVHTKEDAAYAVARNLVREHAGVAKLVVSGDPARAPVVGNPKVHSLVAMAEQATGDVLVISDADILAEDDYAEQVAAEFGDPEVGVVTFPYRAVGGGLWNELEAVGANTEFWGGVVVAQLLGPMDFAVGPTMAVRRECLDAIGGFDALRQYLAEDFVIGRRAAEKGWKVKLSRYVVEHHIGEQAFWPNLRHRIRWYRSTRRSRPIGYLLQVFTYPLPFAAALVALDAGPWTWGVLAGGVSLRVAAAAAVAGALLRSRLGGRFWILLPLQDAFSFFVWIAAFFGNHIEWHGRRFRLVKDGKLRPT